MTPVRLVTVTLVMNAEPASEIADAVNELLRPATFNPEQTLVRDYSFRIANSATFIEESTH